MQFIINRDRTMAVIILGEQSPALGILAASPQIEARLFQGMITLIARIYDPTNADALLTPRPDFVVDAIDNVTAKLHLLQTCLERNIPVVSVTGSGARMDPTQVRVDDLSRTRLDPLARVIRKELSGQLRLDKKVFG